MRKLTATFLSIFLYTSALAGSTPQKEVTTSAYPQEEGYTIYDVNFEGPVNSSSATAISLVLNEANEQDIVRLTINSGGGTIKDLHTMLIAMKDTKATVFCTIDEFAASAAAILAWNCPSLTATPKSVVLYHKVATSFLEFMFAGRLTSNKIDEISSKLKVADILLYTFYLKGAMNTEELDRYWAGHDVAVDADEIVERHSRPERPDRLPRR